ncbi:putative ABC transporter ATP-binding protein YbhF [Rosistilla ulvae]|uniref:Putative ABC transporter ATP-binding protein YbhF n=1 Tax=Rosistilla ulvae TaxID=1930277 RepID=A0A517LY81_9BACT|nr:putative ABC transporter ATP-binding protein YbhF [Rosistilla ulvae]
MPTPCSCGENADKLLAPISAAAIDRLESRLARHDAGFFSSSATQRRVLISANHLTKRFANGNQQVLAVEDLSFDVQPGHVFGLLGPNGAGKTTTLRMVLGLIEPTSGDAQIHGFQVSRDSDEVKRRIGFVSASVGVYPWLTPREVLRFVGDLYGVRPQVAVERIERLSKLLGLEEILDRRCSVLSTGQQQRMNLARALVHDPPVMLMDEPTRGLDIVGSQVVFDYIVHLRSVGKAVIVCTHRLDEAERFCDSFGLLNHGRLCQHGSLGDLQDRTGRTTLTEMFVDLLAADSKPTTEPSI